jgi:hypothetical protein
MMVRQLRGRGLDLISFIPLEGSDRRATCCHNKDIRGRHGSGSVDLETNFGKKIVVSVRFEQFGVEKEQEDKLGGQGRLRSGQGFICILAVLQA